VLIEHDDFKWLAASYGEAPLPPYIRVAVQDPERYQTVVAKHEGSAAAPTAGLHFTPELLALLQSMNVQIEFITLHIGLGTFQSIKSTDPFAHEIHEEYYYVPSATTEALRRARDNNTRVVGVGTTVVRTLETIATELDSKVQEFSGWSRLFIHPPYQPRLVDAVLTNFHLPRTTLLMLVAGFTGVDLILRAYRHAIAQRYRFYSFGDAMLIV
jgi:S-adenosylmethionine:tRNA ribosyltransferase-isomerase